ncbi:hypothetical protein [Pantanalinema sp. GBBB05]|uniref:hypothetical protein n=1 Tax=Pantanalinema sp. GBBB05 TaxID=2604139 RepID=UPI001D1BAFB7|nr:hypothetical protein [Pantanalinema sp. GBBB05]
MFQPKRLQIHPLDWSSRYSSSPAQEPPTRNQPVAANPSSVDALINSLVPEGLSPNKRAIAEHLIMTWLQNAEA